MAADCLYVPFMVIFKQSLKFFICFNLCKQYWIQTNSLVYNNYSITSKKCICIVAMSGTHTLLNTQQGTKSVDHNYLQWFYRNNWRLNLMYTKAAYCRFTDVRTNPLLVFQRRYLRSDHLHWCKMFHYVKEIFSTLLQWSWPGKSKNPTLRNFCGLWFKNSLYTITKGAGRRI
jgi:hypothetical protein